MWKQPMYAFVDEWIKIYHIYIYIIYDEILPSHEKKNEVLPCDNMNLPRGYYAK